MPRPRSQPTPQFVETLTRRALARRDIAIATATPMQRFVWDRYGSCFWVIDAVAKWPFDATPYIAGLVNESLHGVIQDGLNVPQAVRRLGCLSYDD